MQVRSPRPPDEPFDHRSAAPQVPSAGDGPPETTDGPVGGRPTEVSFRVPLGAIVAKIGLAVVIAAASLVVGDRQRLAVGLLAAAAVAVWAARDVAARERLRADPRGIVAVRGYAGHRHLGWDRIERMFVDSRLRFGARTETLEVDAGEEIFLFGRFDLGVHPEEALRALEAVRPSA